MIAAAPVPEGSRATEACSGEETGSLAGGSEALTNRCPLRVNTTLGLGES